MKHQWKNYFTPWSESFDSLEECMEASKQSDGTVLIADVETCVPKITNQDLLDTVIALLEFEGFEEVELPESFVEKFTFITGQVNDLFEKEHISFERRHIREVHN